MSQITVQDPKVTITRELTNIAPKVLTFLATGVTASGLAYVLGTVGISLSPAATSLAVILISAIAGYLKSDTTFLRGGAITQPAPVAAPVAVPVVSAPASSTAAFDQLIASAQAASVIPPIVPTAPVAPVNDQVTSV